jgi:hypothetical protein
VQTSSNKPDGLRRVESKRYGLEQGLKGPAAGQADADAARGLADAGAEFE